MLLALPLLLPALILPLRVTLGLLAMALILASPGLVCWLCAVTEGPATRPSLTSAAGPRSPRCDASHVRRYLPDMDFALSAKAEDVTGRMWDFMREHVFPAETVYERVAGRPAATTTTSYPPVLEELKAEARKRGLWNLFHHELAGLSNLEYASVAEITGWSPTIAPEAINCGAPDTGNMETLMLFGTDEQKQRWLNPLLEGEIRSGFAMTEPDVASSDARNIQTSIVRDGDEYVINGRKWWTSGAADERCQIFIVMGKTDPDGAPHRQQSMVLVPRDTPGLEIIRHLPVFGYQDQHGHSELRFTDVRVPAATSSPVRATGS